MNDRLSARPTHRALLGTALGHALEWYDWGIYAIFVPFFSTRFFDPHDEVSAVLSSLAVFAVGFAARPVGGLVVGRLADRVGRKPMMLATVAGMAAGSLIIGLCPTYATLGAGASAILVLARIVQGLATGGELPSAQTYLAEYAPRRRRGLWSSVIYIASVGGNTVGVLLGLLLSMLLSKSDMASFGWRVPFIVGGVLGAGTLWIRRSLAETAAFTAERKERPRLWQEVLRHRRQAVQVVGMSVGLTVVYYAWVIAAPAYAISAMHVNADSAMLAGVLSSLLLIAVLPAWGALSDRVGRRPVLLISTLGTAVSLFPLQAMIDGSAWRLGVAMAIAMVFIGAGVSILPAAYAEMFPTHIRTVGLAVPYSIAVAAFGGTAPYLQTWMGETAGRAAFTGYVVLLLVVSAMTVLTLPETRGMSLTTTGNDSDDTEGIEREAA
ncbi:MFS transporter [Actinoallomurus sp. NBC_01490]|jgi:MHS family alpha-ketoglutarate permease-like MFS transporter|uniref:MFS transporter n=1 Tax=Actinoallomurus sp. NBC_01490 TaxID=2903557 RepID=UPI002E342C2D|nr:MFS transporter [Actinoallomurus sp. NBC_01490]